MWLKINIFTAKFAENNDKVNVNDTTHTEEVVDESSKKDVTTEDGAAKETNEEKIVLQDLPEITDKNEQVPTIEGAESEIRTTTSKKPTACFSVEKWQQWQDKWKWLFCKNEKIGCSTCRDVSRIVDIGRGVKIAVEWSECAVGVGTTAKSQVKKLCNKIYQHLERTTHNAAEIILKEKSANKLGKLIIESSTVFDEKTNANFRTAYTIAKECMSFKKMKPIVSLQYQNGVLMESIHHSDHACANIIDHIGSQMRQEMVAHIKKNRSFISIAVYETTIYNKSYMIIYLRADVSGQVVDNVFLDITFKKLISLKHTC